MAFRLVDRVVEVGNGRIKAAKALSVGEPYLSDHFPGFPVMPGALMIEAMAQAAAILLRGGAPSEGPPAWRLRHLEAVRFTGMVRPGDVLEVEVAADGDADGLRWFRGSGTVDGRRVAGARFALVRAEEG